MNCNRCGKEMTKEPLRGGDERSFSWWCPFCGSTEDMSSVKNKPAGEDKSTE